MVRGLRTSIRPPREPVVESPYNEERHKLIRDALYGPGVEIPAAMRDAFAEARSRYAAIEATMEDARARPGDDVVVTPLGTSSALPNLYRNGIATKFAYLYTRSCG